LRERCIGSTVTPADGRVGALAVHGVHKVLVGAPDVCGLVMLRCTPPTSDLWLMSGELIFIATGKPTDAAATSASDGERASIVVSVGMWKARSTAFDSVSDSILSPVGQHALDDEARALDVGRPVSVSGPGTAAAAPGCCDTARDTRRPPPPARA